MLKKRLLPSIILALIIFACDTIDDVSDPSIALAPPRPDQNVYACPSTETYHLANCPNTTQDKLIMAASEAEGYGYTACELCFLPPPESIEPHVYVIDGDQCYHLAGCVYLNQTKTAIPKTEAIDQGYTPCTWCNSDAPPKEPHVYVNPGETAYHRALCPDLAEDAILMPKAEAVATGYTECDTCYNPSIEILRNPLNRIVYVCPKYGEVYHGLGCTYLDQCTPNTVESMTLREALEKGYEKCTRCEGFRYHSP